MVRPLLLCILDGWGVRSEAAHNAVSAAQTPHFDALLRDYPNSALGTSGLDVGLPAGQMGNSEVGHMNIGGGRIVLQSLPKIDAAIADGTLSNHPALTQLASDLAQSGKTCHLMGLVSDGGVHAHQGHIIALAEILNARGVKVAIHGFTDGRDTPPQSGKGFISELEQSISGLKNVTIATVSGRYYAMDRDTRWDRVEKAARAIIHAKGEHATDAAAALQASYANDANDEFILPTVIGSYTGMEDGDALIMANFRADRAREILTALLDPAFNGFTANAPKFSHALGMVEYSAALHPFIQTLFPPETSENTLGEVIANAGLNQLRIAETEKYAHVTFFFNGGAEAVFEGEERILIPSPDVATYDLRPEMSAPEVTDKLVDAIASEKFSLIVVNYANTDMVGHTGIMEAAVKAAEAVDASLGRLRSACAAHHTTMLVTADHGNAEEMIDENGIAHTQHTLNLVPFIVANAGRELTLSQGRLCDIAPTALHLMGLPIPQEMTGTILVSEVR